MTTTDYWLLDLKFSKFDSNGPIMQLEFFYWKIILFFLLIVPKTNVPQSYLKIYRQLTDLYFMKQNHQK